MKTALYKPLVEKEAALKAVVDSLKQQQTELEAQLKTAVGEWLQAEREMKRHEPLTPAMKIALRKLVENGATITESDLYGGTSYWIEMPAESNKSNDRINRSVFFGLLSRQAIGDRKYEGGLRYKWQVTEHGKSLINGQSSAQRVSEAVSGAENGSEGQETAKNS